MTKKDQDENWTRLSSEFKEEIKKLHKENGGYEIFGKHNLQSLYNVGDKVRVKGFSPTRTIVNISKDGKYQLSGKSYLYSENEIELI